MNGRTFEELIRPEKDLTGLGPVNRARIFAGEKDGFAPCTAEAVIEILKTYQIPMEGKRAVVVGRSMVVGRPLSMLFFKEKRHSHRLSYENGGSESRVPGRRTSLWRRFEGGNDLREFVKPGAVVADVGINVDENGALKGDVEWDGLEAAAAAAATPAPGGVGSVTTAVLCRHLGGGGHAEIWSGTGAELSRLNKKSPGNGILVTGNLFSGGFFYVGNSGGADLGGRLMSLQGVFNTEVTAEQYLGSGLLGSGHGAYYVCAPYFCTGRGEIWGHVFHRQKIHAAGRSHGRVHHMDGH